MPTEQQQLQQLRLQQPQLQQQEQQHLKEQEQQQQPQEQQQQLQEQQHQEQQQQQQHQQLQQQQQPQQEQQQQQFQQQEQQQQQLQQQEQQQQQLQRRRHSRMLPFGGGGGGGFSGFGGDRLWKTTQSIIATRQLAKKVTFSEEERLGQSADSLYSIFNFFETITPPPTFHTFKEGFQHVSKVMELHPQFLSGLLLKNVEPFERFPYLSYTVFHVQPTNTFIHDPSWVKVIREGHGENQVHHQGGFKELHTIWMDPEDSGLANLSRLTKSHLSAFIIVSCKVLGNARHLEASWREWSGADFILNNLHQHQRASLRRITFYKRAVSRGAFTHVLLAEFKEVTEIYRLRNFVALMNGRHCGLAGLYTIELQFCCAALRDQHVTSGGVSL